MKTKVAEEFLKLLDRHFPLRHIFRKLCNINNVKVSYSTMTNMKGIISGHNRKVLQDTNHEIERKCNCRNPNDCPLNGQCLTPEMVYEATVTTDILGTIQEGTRE